MQRGGELVLMIDFKAAGQTRMVPSGFRVLGVDGGGGLVGQLVAHVADYDLRAFAREQFRLGGALSARAAGK